MSRQLQSIYLPVFASVWKRVVAAAAAAAVVVVIASVVVDTCTHVYIHTFTIVHIHIHTCAYKCKYVHVCSMYMCVCIYVRPVSGLSWDVEVCEGSVHLLLLVS